MARRVPSYDLSAVSVLVVERNPFTRRILIQALRALGIRDLREAGDGAEALKVLRDFEADLITTGFHMEPLNGVEFTRMLRTAPDSPARTTPIIMITAYTEEANVKAARDAGIDEFLAKPVSAYGIYHRIVEVIERRRPFVSTRSYVGPDRHRKPDDAHPGPWRRAEDGDKIPLGPEQSAWTGISDGLSSVGFVNADAAE